MILYGAALKLFVLGAVVASHRAPLQTGNPWADWGCLPASACSPLAVIGVVESAMARLPLHDSRTFSSRPVSSRLSG